MKLLRRKYALFVWLYSLTALISMLANFSVYYLRGCVGIMVLIVIFYTFYVGVKSPRVFSMQNKNSAVCYVLIWCLIYSVSFFKSFIFVDGILWLYVFYGFLLLLINDAIKWRVFDLFIRLLAIILTCSLIEFILYYFLGVAFFSLHVSRGNGQEFENLVFNLVKDGGFPRFQSLADEPGLIGTLCGLLLFVLNKDPKRYKFERTIIIISGIFTISAAFFFLAGVSLMSHKLNLKALFFLGAFLLLFYFVFNDIFYSRIVLRFSGGEIDDRTTDLMRIAFAKAWESGDLWTGVGYGAHEFLGEGEAEDGGAGAIIFLYEFGILGTLLIVLLYSGIVMFNSNAGIWGNLVYLMAFWASFYQRQTIDRPYSILAFVAFAFLLSPRTPKRTHYRLVYVRKKNRRCLLSRASLPITIIS